MQLIKRIVLVLLALLCAAARSSALSPIQLGVEGGVNITNVRLSGFSKAGYSYSADANTGFYAGLSARVDLRKGFYIKPSILYSHTSYDLAATSRTSGQVSGTTVKTNVMQVPVVAGYRLSIFRLEAGPVFNVWSETLSSNYAVAYSAPSAGYVAGLSAALGKFSVSVRYNGQFGDTLQSVQVGAGTGEDIDTRMGSWMIGFGIRF